MTYKLFLDDYRNPVKHEEWVVARSYSEAVEIIEKQGMPKFISFDHDLAEQHYAGDFSGPERTGYDFAKWIVDQCLLYGVRLPDGFNFAVHSMNPVGAKNIRDLMESLLWAIKESGYPTNEEVEINRKYDCGLLS